MSSSNKDCHQDRKKAYKEANLLAGDSIMNYRTVASFAHEEQILKDFDRLLSAPYPTVVRKAHIMGLVLDSHSLFSMQCSRCYSMLEQNSWSTKMLLLLMYSVPSSQ